MQLIKVDINEFEKNLYSKYEEIFPSNERKPLVHIKNLYNKGFLEIIEILDEEKIVGFFITNILPQNPYVLLDFFAIFPEQQSKGYGSKAINLLKKLYKNHEGIYIEVERPDKLDQDINKYRRIKFYEKLGFYNLGYDLKLFNVAFSTFILPINETKHSNKDIINKIKEIYIAVLGKENYTKNCILAEN